ncbi:MAG: chemotaxis response regulator protein-glutamate methylesterase [Candidatus Sericytochromatia bacterium]|nr:chemotaxis response regulator protein-glutamate methylesterase [Candidatus Sericytochromatia bacterium]
MIPIRILFADDSVVNRQMLKKILSLVPDFEVVAVVSNGRLALARIPQLNPDLVILDIEMPEMNGLETLEQIRELYRDLPVIMFSSLTESGAAITIQALSMGANDYVTKPQIANTSSQEELEKYILEAFEPRIRNLCQKQRSKLSTNKQIYANSDQFPKILPKVHKRVDVVGIGISTGGPNALASIFPKFPVGFPVAILLVQHMPPLFTRYLAERLDQISEIRVVEAETGMVVEAGCAYLAPGNYHMSLESQEGLTRILLNQEPPENSCRPSVDVLFRAMAQTFGSASLGVIMTGMGQDGLRGCEWLHEAGGQIFAQDEASSIIWGMPGYVARAGLADKVLPLNEIGGEIVSRVLFKR